MDEVTRGFFVHIVSMRLHERKGKDSTGDRNRDTFFFSHVHAVCKWQKMIGKVCLSAIFANPPEKIRPRCETG